MALDTLMRVTENQIRKLTPRLKALEQKQAAGQKLNADERNELQDYKRRLQRQKKFLAQKRVEQSNIGSKYNAYLKRFFQLKKIRGPTPNVSPTPNVIQAAKTTSAAPAPKRQT